MLDNNRAFPSGDVRLPTKETQKPTQGETRARKHFGFGFGKIFSGQKFLPVRDWPNRFQRLDSCRAEF
jgi:hypothetical protein